MKILRTWGALREWRQSISGSLGFVPTMGALHEGHLSLVRASALECDQTVVSIFVNPLQFDRAEDLQSYPRNEQDDLQKLASCGVDTVYCPDVTDFYGPDFSTFVEVCDVPHVLCGRSREGHFRGVTTVVSKLFHGVQPDVAFFGQKDAQQFFIIRKMVRDQGFPLEVRVCPTVREADGLAMSSRNRLLDFEQRKRAVALYQTLFQVGSQIAQGARDVQDLVKWACLRLQGQGEMRIDYIEIVDYNNLKPIVTIESELEVLVAGAVFLGSVRLIDNVIALGRG